MLCVALAVVGGAGATAAAGETDVIRGTATYRERMALPTGTILEVILADVSRMDVAAEVISRVEIADPGNPPYRFELPYDKTAIDEGHAYAVRARITRDGALIFTTDTVVPVLTRGAGREVELLLKRTGQAGSSSVSGSDLVGSYEGTLPCADCEGIKYRIDLFADGVFYQRLTYLGREDGDFDALGSWSLAPDGATVSLFGGDPEPDRWRFVVPGTLRKLDREGREIASQLNYDIVLTEGLERLEPRLAMRGMYRYLADAATFHECLTGRRFPVAMEAASIELERAYRDARPDAESELLAAVVGRLTRRPPVEGEITVEMLIVEEFIGVWPGETCNAPESTGKTTKGN